MYVKVQSLKMNNILMSGKAIVGVVLLTCWKEKWETERKTGSVPFYRCLTLPSNNFLKLAKLYGNNPHYYLSHIYYIPYSYNSHIDCFQQTSNLDGPCALYSVNIIKKWTNAIELGDIWKLSTIRLTLFSWVIIRQYICKIMLKITYAPYKYLWA